MKDSITLVISRGKNYLNLYHKGELVGKIEVSELNRGNQTSLKLSSDKTNTIFKITKENIDDDFFNKEEFNK